MKGISSLLLFISAIFLSSPTAFAAPAKSDSDESEEAPCLIYKSVKLSFYGRATTRDPIAYPECGRPNAGGKGTFDSPLTMATAPGEFGKCEIIYIPHLLKYVRFEDVCTDCVSDFAKDKYHVRIWTGNSMSGREEQARCIRDFTPSYAMTAIRNPSRGLLVDQEKLYHWGTRDPCRLDHRYRVVNNNAFCFPKDEPASDHEQNQRNSVNAMRHPYPRPDDEQPIYYEVPPQEPEAPYEAGDTSWQLQDNLVPEPGVDAPLPVIVS